MNDFDKTKLLKMSGILLLLFLLVGTASYFHRKNSITLTEYAQKNPATSSASETETAQNSTESSPSDSDISGTEDSSQPAGMDSAVTSGDIPTGTLVGAMLNNGSSGQDMLSSRVTYVGQTGNPAQDFYYEELSASLLAYITGISYPSRDLQQNDISPEALRYVHILHYDFEGNPAEGELICNVSIADDLLSIFYELYQNEYQIEKVHLIEDYAGEDEASMADNNTSCFNYRVVEGSTTLSKHAYGLAIDINPLYNPYITYEGPDGFSVAPANADGYADRSAEFPYKIDKNDLCYQLFTEHGFTWGGNWNSVKDYQHFQKTPVR